MKPKYHFCFFLLVVLIAALPSCAPVLYTNVGHNVPLFHEKGEVSINAGYGSVTGENYFYGLDASAEGEGFNAQGAVAIGKSTAVISSFYSMKDDGEDVSSKGNYVELGVGKFKYSAAGNLVSEIFVGTGFGAIKNLEQGEYLNLKYVKPFVQPSVGLSTKHFDLAFTPRIALVSYTGGSENMSDPAQQYTFRKFWKEKKIRWYLSQA